MLLGPTAASGQLSSRCPTFSCPESVQKNVFRKPPARGKDGAGGVQKVFRKCSESVQKVYRKGSESVQKVFRKPTCPRKVAPVVYRKKSRKNLKNFAAVSALAAYSG
eukprot:1187863-Prorocentrum_minimum.AAC.1